MLVNRQIIYYLTGACVMKYNDGRVDISTAYFTLRVAVLRLTSFKTCVVIVVMRNIAFAWVIRSMNGLTERLT